MNPNATPPAGAPNDATAIGNFIETMGGGDRSLDFGSPNDIPIMDTPIPAPVTPPAPQPAAPPVAPVTPSAPPASNPDVIPLAPLMPTPAATPPAEQIPTWAQGIITDLAALKAAPAPTPTPVVAPPAEWKPQSWAEVEAKIAEAATNATTRAQELVQAGFTEQQAADRAQQEAQTEQLAAADRGLDTQVAQLETAGYLPPITSPNDPQDAGRAARRELYAFAIAMNSENLPAVMANLHTHHQNGYYYDHGQNAMVRRGSQSTAARAPIAGAAPTAGPAGVGPTMADIINKDIYTLADEANSAFPA